MKTLLLMRHAKSSWAEGSQPDRERPLNERGRRDAPRMGLWLRQQGLRPDLVISSTARRAVQTAAAVIEAIGFGGEWQQAVSLYEADAEAYFALLQQLPDDCGTVLVIAHNPATEAVLEALTGEAEVMPTGAIAQISLPIESWQGLQTDMNGHLEQVARPRQIA